MSDQIPREVVEAAEVAYAKQQLRGPGAMEAAIRAAYRKCGIRLVRRPARVVYDGFHGDGQPRRVSAAVRWESDWLPVEQE